MSPSRGKGHLKSYVRASTHGFRIGWIFSDSERQIIASWAFYQKHILNREAYQDEPLDGITLAPEQGLFKVDTLEDPTAPLPWVPAFAGTTSRCAGMTIAGL